MTATVRHRRLLDSALTVLRRDGPGALTMRAVADQAGCSTTGIYTRFGSKSGLVEAITVHGLDALDQAMAPAYRSGDPMRLALAYRRWALANPNLYLVMFARAVPDHEPSESTFERGSRSFEALTLLLANQGFADPSSVAYHLYATVHGHVMLELVGFGPADGDELEPWYEIGMNLVMNGLRRNHLTADQRTEA